MIIICSENGEVGLHAAMEVLKGGGSALDAVEAGIRLVEANAEDHSVGLGGYPNLLGTVELDASIMEGSTRMSGAVGALKGFAHPISIARAVLEKLPHVLLVSEGAERFAREMGFDEHELLTETAAAAWREKLLQVMDATTLAELPERQDLWRWVRLSSDPQRSGGTTNFIVLDNAGNLASGVSTSGWFAKYPGRLGDSPIIGAGNYADSRYGAATCTGMGEMAIRAGTARSVILYLQQGAAPEEAGRRVMEDLDTLGGPYLSGMNVLILDAQGRHAGMTSHTEGRNYLVLSDTMAAPERLQRTYIPTRQHWQEA